MKKNLLFTIASLLVLPYALLGQLSITPNPAIVEDVDITKTEVIASGTIKNGFEVAKDLVWTRNIIMLSESWTTAVCDKNTCYLTTTETAEFNLAAGEENTMNVYIYPENNEGMAIVEVTITDKDDENISVKGTYYFNASPNSTQEVEGVKVDVFPNPTEGRIRISSAAGLQQVQVFSMTGQNVHQTQLASGEWLDIQTLPKGTYLLRLIDQNRQTLGAQLIQKQ
ncbi:MAG: T9SS type A sorting domain-containing protein [Saprospiraceae bacterium]|nr:T9SS type A sorting domain-containing protein [Saprospiraceae bacterium]